MKANGRGFLVKVLVKNGHLKQEKQILERDNYLVRPALKNVHYLFCRPGGAEFELGFRYPKVRSDFWQQVEVARGNPQLKAVVFVGGGMRREADYNPNVFSPNKGRGCEFLAQNTL